MKVRICFSKTEAGRYLSHLDLARAMERGLRRAKAPLAFSEGYNPHPKIAFASALAVGTTGRREYADVELASRVNIRSFSGLLEAALPPAIAFVAAEEVGVGSRSLSAVINLAIYRIVVQIRDEDEAKAAAGIAGLLAAGELWRKPKEKPGKKPVPAKEVRGLVRRIEVIGTGEYDVSDAGETAGDGMSSDERPGAGYRALTIEMELGMTAEGQLRPQELWEMIGEAGGVKAYPPATICRTALLIQQDGKVFGPMEGVAV